MNLETLEDITYAWIAIALIVHVTMFFIKAPFGRHTSEKWGRSVNNKLGWFIMELPSLVIMVYFFFRLHNAVSSYVWILFLLWIIHYTNRTFIYPLRIKSTPKRMPVFIVGSGIFFNIINAGLNGYYLSELAPTALYDYHWLLSPNFIIGIILFFGGLFINWRSDTILIRLRKKGETGYKIPNGFLFDLISTPNLFGEIIEWTGFALMAWNLPAFSFMIWTFANLVPRSKNHHDWYHQNFTNYPKERKIIFPFIY
jgi:3-oxo-5-alpha-steroid 4-dehydrogenase 1